MLFYDWFDSLGCFFYIVEENSKYKIKYNVSFNYAIIKRTAYKAKIPIEDYTDVTNKVHVWTLEYKMVVLIY